jgi:hypothetical protein
MNKLSESAGKLELGVYGRNTYTGEIRADEFLYQLRGKKAIRKFMEMRENSSTVGAVMYATEQVLRDVDIKVVPADDSDQAKKEAEFVESVLDDMEHSLDDHISEALSFLTYGFAWFEVVYKRRGGDFNSPKKKSKYDDGRIGVRKLAIRAPWTVDRFEVDLQTGDVLGMRQDTTWGKPSVLIPTGKSLYYRTTTFNNDPSGRSILRNAYTAYTYLNNLQSIEAIAVERELHGVPIGRMPAEYLSANATDDQKAVRQDMERILRDLKLNEQGYALLASDVYTDAEGKPTDHRMMDIELITSNGSRAVDIDPIIRRYQHDIARSIMAEFLMLGSSSTGSYALSKSKTDLFLRSMESYINTIVDVLNRQLIHKLWELNGLDYAVMPKLVAGDVAPHDLKELGSYLRNLNGAQIDLSDQPKIINALLDNAELPNIDEDEFLASLEEKKQKEHELNVMRYTVNELPGSDGASEKPKEKPVGQ